MPAEDERIARIQDAIAVAPDFPKPGITFRDTLPLFKDTALLSDTISLLADHIREKFGSVDIIVGLEAKGFLYAPMVAVQLGCSFVPVRKLGKLPGEVVRLSYEKNGTNTIEVQVDAIRKGQRVVIVDDLMLTGEYTKAAEQLLMEMGGDVLGSMFLCEVVDLKGSAKLKRMFHSVLQY